MHYFIGSGSLHLMAKRPRLSLTLAALLVGGMYTGHRMVHAAAAAPVQVSASKVLPPTGIQSRQHAAATVEAQVSVKFLGESQVKNR